MVISQNIAIVNFLFILKAVYDWFIDMNMQLSVFMNALQFSIIFIFLQKMDKHSTSKFSECNTK